MTLALVPGHRPTPTYPYSDTPVKLPCPCPFLGDMEGIRAFTPGFPLFHLAPVWQASSQVPAWR